MLYHCEYTDTFGGEANYSWVRRATFMIPDTASDLAIVRRAKRALGLQGLRCARSDMGEIIELRPYRECTVIFITPDY